MRLVRLEEISAERGNRGCDIGPSYLCGVHEASDNRLVEHLIGFSISVIRHVIQSGLVIYWYIDGIRVFHPISM